MPSPAGSPLMLIGDLADAEGVQHVELARRECRTSPRFEGLKLQRRRCRRVSRRTPHTRATRVAVTHRRQRRAAASCGRLAIDVEHLQVRAPAAAPPASARSASSSRSRGRGPASHLLAQALGVERDRAGQLDRARIVASSGSGGTSHDKPTSRRRRGSGNVIGATARRRDLQRDVAWRIRKNCVGRARLRETGTRPPRSARCAAQPTINATNSGIELR